MSAIALTREEIKKRAIKWLPQIGSVVWAASRIHIKLFRAALDALRMSQRARLGRSPQ